MRLVSTKSGPISVSQDECARTKAVVELEASACGMRALQRISLWSLRDANHPVGADASLYNRFSSTFGQQLRACTNM